MLCGFAGRGVLMKQEDVNFVIGYLHNAIALSVNIEEAHERQCFLNEVATRIVKGLAERNPSANVGYAGPGIEKRAGWRRVEDKLPTKENRYLVYCDGFVETAFWYDDDDAEWSKDNVTHWMPLPAPPGA